MCFNNLTSKHLLENYTFMQFRLQYNADADVERVKCGC